MKKEIILKPKNYLRIILDLTKLQWFPLGFGLTLVFLITGVFVSTSSVFRKGTPLGAQMGYGDGTINETQQVPGVYRNQYGELQSSGDLIDKSFKELSINLEDMITEIEQDKIDTWMLKKYLLRAQDLNKQGDEKQAKQEILTGIRLAEEIMLTQKADSPNK